MNIRNDLSKRNKYWISKHRYLELKHYCLQYPDLKQYLSILTGDIQHHGLCHTGRSSNPPDDTQRIGLLRAEYSRNIELVERAAYEADEILASYILIAVTRDKTFPYLKTVMEIPCERGMYYDRYRKFFWLLDKKKGL